MGAHLRYLEMTLCLAGARLGRGSWRSRTKVTTLGRFVLFTLPPFFICILCTTVLAKLNPLLEKRVIPGEGAKEKQAKGEGLQQKGTTSQRRGKFEVASVQDAVL